MSRFDAAYYKRFYGRQGVQDRRRVAQIATAVHSMCQWWGVSPRTVLDVGSGVGMWRDWYRTKHPGVRMRSLDISPYACERWGHEQRDIAVWRPERPSDLVVCHSVLQYLDDDGAAAAIEHLAAATRFVLYLEAPTLGDLTDVVDPQRTDMAVNGRTASWYRERLERHFQQAGAGLWVRRGTVVLFELEAAGR